MSFTQGILERNGFTLEKVLSVANSHLVGIWNLTEIFSIEPRQLPAPIVEITTKVCEDLDFKTYKQLMLELKSGRETDTGALVPTTGAGKYHPRKAEKEQSPQDIIRAKVEMMAEKFEAVVAAIGECKQAVEDSPELVNELQRSLLKVSLDAGTEFTRLCRAAPR